MNLDRKILLNRYIKKYKNKIIHGIIIAIILTTLISIDITFGTNLTNIVVWLIFIICVLATMLSAKYYLLLVLHQFIHY